MKKTIHIVLGICAWLGAAQVCFAGSTQVDALIEKLVEKNILTKSEAIKLKGEIAADEKLAREEGMKQSLPDWVQKLKLTGDFRLRHEWSKRNDSTDTDRSRGRLRYRLGLETKVFDTFTVAAGLASNGGSPRSTNQSFTDTFAKSSINLDYAYGQWTPNEYLTLTGGKMKIPFWQAADMLWDSDITPEGGAANLSYKVNESFKLFNNIGVFVLEEAAGDPTDPFMYLIQPGIEAKAGDLSLKTAFTYYGFSDGQGKTILDNRSSPTTNTTSGTQYKFEYDSYAVDTDLSFNKPLRFLGEQISSHVPTIGAFGQYIHNPEAPDENTGWIAGMYVGDKKVNGKKQWQAKFSYRKLGRDAWLDVFPDSDFYGGATDVEGYEAILEYGLSKNVILGIDYYRSKRLSAAETPESVLQTDLNFKF